jgi:hypothetical protein
MSVSIDSEADLKTWFADLLRRQTAIVFPVVAGMMQQPGWPDCYFAHRRLSGWYETKYGRNPCSELQKRRIKDLRDRDVFAVVVRWREGKLLCEGPTGEMESVWVTKGDESPINFMLRAKTRIRGSGH